MKNFRLRIGAAIAALLIGATAALALTNPASYAPRQAPVQHLHYFRKLVNFNDANISVGVPFGAIPQNAIITSIKCDVVTAFNAGTTNSLSIGTTQGGSDLLAAGTTSGTNCVAATTGLQPITSAAGVGLGVTGGAATGREGGFDLWVKYAQTGTAATAGKVVFTIEYIPDNDQ